MHSQDTADERTRTFSEDETAATSRSERETDDDDEDDADDEENDDDEYAIRFIALTKLIESRMRDAAASAPAPARRDGGADARAFRAYWRPVFDGVAATVLARQREEHGGASQHDGQIYRHLTAPPLGQLALEMWNGANARACPCCHEEAGPTTTVRAADGAEGISSAAFVRALRDWLLGPAEDAGASGAGVEVAQFRARPTDVDADVEEWTTAMPVLSDFNYMRNGEFMFGPPKMWVYCDGFEEHMKGWKDRVSRPTKGRA